MRKQTIAAFDFDGTITTKDTLFDFIHFYLGKYKLITGLIMLSPILILYKLGFIKNSAAKQKLFSYFFKGCSIAEFNQKCELYSQRISKICKADALDKIKWHKQQNHTIVIVSASISNWIKPWAQTNGFDKILATEINTQGQYIDGTFASTNCYGQEKVNRLINAFPDREKYILYAYGDSSGDKELLALADYPFLYKQ